MSKALKSCLLFWLVTAMPALFPAKLAAQTPFVYVNDNNGNFSANTATMFKNSPPTKLTPSGGIPFPTTGTGLAGPQPYSALKDQTLFTTGTPPTTSCLFISEALPGANSPNGQISIFNVNNSTGALTLTGHFLTPSGDNGAPNGIALATAAGAKFLYAAYSGTHTIVVYSAIWNGSQCELDFVNMIAASGLAGGAVDGMSLSANRVHLVVAYADGSVQAFKAAGFVLTPECASAQNSMGFTDGNQGVPAGVDITRDSRFAIFGDSAQQTELEVASLPLVCSPAPTTDFGGVIHANGVNLGPGVGSDNVWLSPNGRLIYVSNTLSKQVTSVAYAEPLGLSLAVGCTAGFTNPTVLHPASYNTAAGIQTATISGTGTRIFIGEYGAPSSVALLNVDSVGCTKEAPLSPFVDTSSNYLTHGFASYSLSANPPRPF